MSLDVWLTLPINENLIEYQVYHSNITHNLGSMADAAGLYEPLWRPYDLLNTGKAIDLIQPLTRGLERLEEYPKVYRLLEASNGWGTYENLVKFTRDYLEACKRWPHALVHVST